MLIKRIINLLFKVNKIKIWLILFVVAAIILGGFYIFYIWQNTLATLSQNAMTEVRMIEVGLDKAALKKLDGNLTDIEKIDYQKIKNSLMRVPQIDKNIRFAYIYAQKGSQVFILADSESPSSKDYSPPGQEFSEYSPQDIKPFIDKKPLITDPVKDRWGTWVSILVPMVDPGSGEVIAALGLDYPVDQWRRVVYADVFRAGMVVLAFFLLVLILYIVLLNRSLTVSREKNFRSFFESSNDIILVSDKQGKILYANNIAEKKLGYALKDLFGMDFLVLYQKNKRKDAAKLWADILASKKNDFSLLLESKDGATLSVRMRFWFGDWNGTSCVFFIAEELGLEQELLDKFNKIFENNPALMAISSISDGKFTDVNQSFLEKTGYSKEEVIGNTSAKLKLFVEDNKQQLAVQKLRREGFIHDVELSVRTKSGGILDGIFYGDIIEVQGKKYFLTLMIDQTERKIAEKKLYELQERTRASLTEAEMLNKTMIGRELKMVEMKKKINDLEEKLSKLS